MTFGTPVLLTEFVSDLISVYAQIHKGEDCDTRNDHQDHEHQHDAAVGGIQIIIEIADEPECHLNYPKNDPDTCDTCVICSLHDTDLKGRMELLAGIEPVTCALPRRRYTSEPQQPCQGQ